ncbi:MAG: putative Ig domain-containing protein [Leptospiraceae bacterium]|nr:putative Ig domain-containing protein [Leptospiraceae bacterium]
MIKKSTPFFLVSLAILILAFSLQSCDQLTGKKSNEDEDTNNLIALLALSLRTSSPLTSITFAKTNNIFYTSFANSKLSPTVVGTLRTCSSNPTLPAGLTIEAATCAISGTPTSGTTATFISHRITGSDNSVTKEVTIGIKIKSAPVCADGDLDSGETCDDGNTVNGDGCNSTCSGP